MKIIIDTDKKTVEVPGSVPIYELQEIIEKYNLKDYILVSPDNINLNYPPGVRKFEQFDKFTPYYPIIGDFPKKQEFWYGNTTYSNNTEIQKEQEKYLIKG